MVMFDNCSIQTCRRSQPSIPVATQTLPEGLIIKNSLITGAGQGVFTSDKSLERDIIFGPYAGVKIYSELEAHQSGYCWQASDVSLCY